MNLFCVKGFNSDAVAHFQHGDSVRAQQIMLAALRHIRQLCVDEDEDEDQASPCTQYYGSELAYDVYSVPLNKDEDDDSIFQEIYNAAFLLTNDIPVSAAETAAVLLFNVGLIHHRNAIQFNKRKEMAKALQLYQQSLGLLETDDKPYSATLAVLTAALCNNMAQIFTAFYKTEQARAMMDFMQESIERMQLDLGGISEDDFEFFNANLYFANMDDFKFAPAA
jgi:hypothetical protein